MTFAKTTFGPPAPTGQDTNKHALIADQQNGIVEMVDDAGITHPLRTMLSMLLTPVVLSTITTAQNMVALALKAGVLNKTSRAIMIQGSAVFTCAGTPQITVTVKLGGVTLVTIQTPAIGNAQTNGQLQFCFLLSVTTVGASGKLESHGEISVQGGSALSAAVPQYLDQNIAVSSAIDLTAAQNLVVTVAATSTISALTVRQTTAEVVN